jgi:hypothetical protein
MGKSAEYTCSFCSKKFSRKWNATRHNNDIHKGLASIDYRLKKGLIALNKPSSKIAPDYSIIPKFEQFDLYFENNIYASPSLPPPSSYPFRSFNNHHLKKKTNKSIFYMNEQEKDDLLYRNLEQMSVSFEKLEKLFVEAPYLIMPYKSIEEFLSNMIITH